MELMLIEKDARKPILKAIDLEKEILSFEQRERLKGKVILSCEEYTELRRRFIAVLCQINAVANPEGKGRDDLSVDILIAAESVSRRISASQSKAVRTLADEIKKSFTNIRVLLRKYEENIEVVDPQLKNNPELVEVLIPFEKSWEKGKEFLIHPKTCNQLIYFSQLIEGVAEKYKEVQEKIDSIDTELFVIFPCLIVLNSLDGDDRGICKTFYPPLEIDNHVELLHYEGIKNNYENLRGRSNNGYQLYNLVEQAILDRTLNEGILKSCCVTRDEVHKLVHDIKRTSMGLQRHKPAEWNGFLETAMGQAL